MRHFNIWCFSFLSVHQTFEASIGITISQMGSPEGEQSKETVPGWRLQGG